VIVSYILMARNLCPFKPHEQPIRSMPFSRTIIALESRLSACRNVRTLGVRPRFSDYSDRQRQDILDAAIVYYPSAWYAELFDTMGKATFPSHHTYRFAQDKIRQTALFELLDIPHPRTRVFYGPIQHRTILEFFDFPFVMKQPRGSSRGAGVQLIRNRQALEAWLKHHRVAYVQEFIPMHRDLRVVVIAGQIVHAYWRVAAAGDFRTNVACGGTVRFDPVPQQALDLARTTAIRCRFDDVGIDICRSGDDYLVLEANVKYGTEGFAQANIDYVRLMEEMIEDGRI